MDEALEKDINEVLVSRKRLKAVENANILDTPVEKVFDDMVVEIRDELSVPVSMISIVDMNRQFLKSQQGLPDPFASNREMPISHAFCQHTIHKGDTYAINDMSEVPIFYDHPSVKKFNVQSYLGEPLVFEGEIIGTVCLIDFKPRQWNRSDIAVLKKTAEKVLAEIGRQNGAL